MKRAAYNKFAGYSGVKFVDYTSKRFGALVCIDLKGREGNNTIWTCVCDCGNQVDVIVHNLKNGNTKSCGCRINAKKPTKLTPEQKEELIKMLFYYNKPVSEIAEHFNISKKTVYLIRTNYLKSKK